VHKAKTSGVGVKINYAICSPHSLRTVYFDSDTKQLKNQALAFWHPACPVKTPEKSKRFNANTRKRVNVVS